MDAWQTTVESRLGTLHNDISGLRGDLGTKFLWLLGAFAAGFIILASAGVTGFLTLTNKIDAKADATDAKIERIEASIAKQGETLARIDEKLK